MFSSGGFSVHMTCGLKVDTRCKGWDRTMSKILGKIQGVSYDLDAEEGMIYISGKVEAQKIVRKIAKYGKHAELCWIRTGDHNIYANSHVADERASYMPYGPMPMPPYPYGRPLPYHGGHYP
ncbi:heavy metal-associated isoprenylated plant protein 32-like [Senna tora]|uniref:Heavy metal-associated isoprenylated plant protein 32-like n=1 Tax=Senna tora TaxID=362788 RepID=A0A834SKG6_9FABA|nr:heavy metal-associated isoprenylated plant protein 32-like [Senna tora]